MRYADMWRTWHAYADADALISEVRRLTEENQQLRAELVLNGEQGDTPMPPDLVAGLKAAAEELRGKADYPEFAMIASWYRALTTLLDGMLAEHQRLFVYPGYHGKDICNSDGDVIPCPSLRLVADLVSTVLGRDLNG
jgi:hypothetical protein